MKKIESIQSAKLAVSPGPFSTGVSDNGFYSYQARWALTKAVNWLMTLILR